MFYRSAKVFYSAFVIYVSSCSVWFNHGDSHRDTFYVIHATRMWIIRNSEVNTAF